MPILFQNGRIGRVGYFKFFKIFHHDNFEKSLSKVVEAFKVWAVRGIPVDWKFSKCVFRSNTNVKPLKMVLG